MVVVVPKKKESTLWLFTLDFGLELDNIIQEKIPSPLKCTLKSDFFMIPDWDLLSIL